MNNDLQSIGPAVLSEVYNLAESLYLMQGNRIPEGRTFTRGLSDEAERCWSTATICYHNTAGERFAA